MKKFPVLRLNQNISNDFQKYISMDILGGVKNGLDPIITFFDEDGIVTDVACIYEDRIRLSPYFRHVKVSAAFAQVLWIICSIALRNHDSLQIEYEVSIMSESEKKLFYKELEDNPHYRYLKSISDHKKSLDISADMVNLIVYIVYNKLDEEKISELYTQLDMDSEYGVRVNSLYKYAMIFILLHEFSHHYLNHDMNSEGSVDDEMEADQNAFWSLYSDLEGQKKISAMMGILCSLVSLIFINCNLQDDGIHPKPVERIFKYYEIIKDENLKYCGLLVHLFYVWAVYADDKNVPPLEGSFEDTLNNIKEYLLAKENFNNN